MLFIISFWLRAENCSAPCQIPSMVFSKWQVLLIFWHAFITVKLLTINHFPGSNSVGYRKGVSLPAAVGRCLKNNFLIGKMWVSNLIVNLASV